MFAITLIGFSLIFFYSLTSILKFYGIGEYEYGSYVLFYMMIVMFVLVLPNSFPKV
jgi:hypothetical protein